MPSIASTSMRSGTRPVPCAELTSIKKTKIVLTDLEKATISLSRGDHILTLAKRSEFQASIDRLSGLKPSNSLADPALDALRRFAITMRFGLPVEGQALDDLFAVGYTCVHAELVRQALREECQQSKLDDNARGTYMLTLLTVSVALFAAIVVAWKSYGLAGLVTMTFLIAVALVSLMLRKVESSQT
ncbi:hypothetical protein K3177_15015 [Qipengyuania sp. GH25]|uniref:DUF2335 domain-containing protein n=1 Tax=Qipengyuania pacifica TaxID=2860199 RepID=A0ABS7JKA6_9SPHN|nr:hypothetical protein [Qipengyuania aerophila]MBX7489817.1 hypothetical protein [Qipengyuania aerophila]